MEKPRDWTPKDVEAYLARFGVEEAVQAAVNSAIRNKAVDPILHVADFLEATARAQEANEEPEPADTSSGAAASGQAEGQAARPLSPDRAPS